MKSFSRILSAGLLLGLFMFGTVSSSFADKVNRTEQFGNVVAIVPVIPVYSMEANTVYVSTVHFYGTVTYPEAVSYPTITRCNSPPNV